ncbi:regulatory protein RecX [Lachnobacterium bovis]|uniref:Regulatory protein RecX n=1 Tax=Lachnobacterium bovis TaxID=140626 RepID=A0A1H9TTH0_9FIRM|nr:regulatory protein RecX [Lachnobacterium bovis]SES00399.1 regulatory protein [Lachnobacterium bovis]
MNQISVESIMPVSQKKYKVRFDNGVVVELYKGDIKAFSLSEGKTLDEEQQVVFFEEFLGKRATKRAMHLLEKCDRTECEIRNKLKKNMYPEECIDIAINYLYSYHYLDDMRYAQNYVMFYNETRSKQKIKCDLQAKGVGREIINDVLEEYYQDNEMEQIKKLLEKKQFNPEGADAKEFNRVYSFLMRKGFKSSNVLKMMKKDNIYYD